MAKIRQNTGMGKKTRTSFKPGQSGNPAGRPALPAEIKAARAINQIELEKILNHVAFLPMPEIKALTKSSEAPAFVVGAAKIVEKMAKYGDIWAANFLLDRMIGRTREMEARDVTPPVPRGTSQQVKKTFPEFVETARYPRPYARQVDMMKFGTEETDPRLVLGARGYGKTDYITILGDAYDIYSNWFDGLHLDPLTAQSVLIISKSKSRNAAMIYEIARALEANGVPLEQENASCIRVEGLLGKDHSIEAIPLKTSFRGRHPKRIVMDDPVTEEDVSEATRKLVKRKYDEAYKLCKNLVVIGQPAHAFDLYAELRGLLKKMEVPHGSIPELDADLEAMAKAGVDRDSIEMSYHLRIPVSGTVPFAKIKYCDEFPMGETVAFLDPSDGGDFTALSIVRMIGDGIFVQGHAWKRAWYLCDDLPKILQAHKVQRLWFETNATGSQPIVQLQASLGPLGIGVVGTASTSPKHAVIMSAGSMAHLIHLSKTSDRAYTEQVTRYELGSKHDDAPDSLARCLERIGLIRGT